ncbi:hypothetical protein ACO9S2_15395 [Nitrospira sp. NS4]|uniref:hypothetical protein n=1 Tax=Nitrospira sp. NS4 TaxID=3414498 RepID=UPI003C2C05C7
MDLQIGSNLYRNTDGTIEVEGVPLMQVAQHPSTGALLVSFALFDQTGKMLVKLVDSNITFNERRAYDVTKTPKTVVLKETASGKVLLQLEAKAPDVVMFSKGEFRTMKGHTLEVSEKEWKLDKLKAGGVTQDQKGGSVTIG